MRFTVCNNAIQFEGNLIMFAGAIAFGNVIDYGSVLPANSDSPESRYHTTGEHERQHPYQGQVLGPLYIPAAALSLLSGVAIDFDSHGRHAFVGRGPQSDPPRPFR